MITHLVLLRRKPGVGRDDPRLARIAVALDALPKQIAGLRAWEHGFNTTPDDDAWDYGVRAVFADRGELEAYFSHPAHQPVLAALEEVAELAFVDLES